MKVPYAVVGELARFRPKIGTSPTNGPGYDVWRTPGSIPVLTKCRSVSVLSSFTDAMAPASYGWAVVFFNIQFCGQTIHVFRFDSIHIWICAILTRFANSAVKFASASNFGLMSWGTLPSDHLWYLTVERLSDIVVLRQMSYPCCF